MLDDLLYRLTARKPLRDWLIPLARAYLRYVPLLAGKARFWDRVVNPYLAWQSHDFVASTVFGMTVGGNTADMIQQYLYYFGIWEPDLTHWIASRLSAGDYFIDVGANIGYYSLLASKLVGNAGGVIAIEAHPTIFGLLTNNLRRNRTRNVRAVNVAAADRCGRTKLFHGPDHNIGEATLLEGPGLVFAGEVNTAPLTDVIRPEEMRRARLIKIDVEGAELAVVAGITELLDHASADLEVIIEVHPSYLARQGKRAEEVIDRVMAFGFQAYVLQNDYSAMNCLSPPQAMKPVPLQSTPRDETVLVFSRQD